MGRVEGKVALVTGGGSGLGAADCVMLAEEGAIAIVTDRDLAAAEAVAAGIGGKAIALPLDVASEAAWIATIAEIERRFGRLDILVNNAGVTENCGFIKSGHFSLLPIGGSPYAGRMSRQPISIKLTSLSSSAG